MDQLEALKRRARYNSVFNLKTRTFSDIIKKSYNSELIYKSSDLSNPLRVIIQNNSLEDSNGKIRDRKLISSPLENSLKVGDIIFWERTKSNWMVFLQRNTEKNYFLGELREANYNITWKDNNGRVLSQLGNFERGTGSLKKDDFLDYLENKAILILPKNDISLSLKRYTKFNIDRDTWEVDFIDTSTYKSMIIFSLRITQRNKDLDTEEIPNGNKQNNIKIISNLDTFDTAKLGETFIPFFQTILDGNKIEDSYDITIDKGVYNDDTKSILYNQLGQVILIVKSYNTGYIKKYVIQVRDTLDNPKFAILGNTITKATLSYTYTLQANVDYKEGTWAISPEGAEIIKSNKDECLIRTSNKPQKFKISYKIDDKEEAFLEIDNQSLFDY